MLCLFCFVRFDFLTAVMLRINFSVMWCRVVEWLTGSRRFEVSCRFNLVGHSALKEGFHCTPLHQANRVRLQLIQKARHVSACGAGVQRSQLLAVVTSGRVSSEQDRAQPSMSQCHFGPHKPHTDWSAFEHGLATSHLSHGKAWHIDVPAVHQCLLWHRT
jgi:hypothetical protein